MRYNINQIIRDIEKYTNNAPKYSWGISVVISGVKTNDIKAIAKWLSRYTAKYTDISAYTVYSEVESKGCIKRYRHNKKRGRPAVEIIGTMSIPHMHSAIISTTGETANRKVSGDIKSYFNKRKKRYPYLKQHKTKSLSEVSGYIRYMNKQASEQHMCGTFDFEYFLNPLCDENFKDKMGL